MKTLTTLTLACTLVLLIGLTGCMKERNNFLTFQFKTGQGYTSSDVKLAAGQSCTVGFIALKSENGDPLQSITGDYTTNSNGNSMRNFYFDLSPNANAFSNTFTIDAPNGPGYTYNYTFTLTTVNGASKSLKLNITAL